VLTFPELEGHEKTALVDERRCSGKSGRTIPRGGQRLNDGARDGRFDPLVRQA
jgi:hypothetical protein